MTIKELKANLLVSLYNRYKENRTGAIQLTELCKERGIIYDSLSQLSSAAQSLKDSGYINVTFFEGGDGIVMMLTADGIEYVEENLLSQEDLVIDGLQDTSKLVQNGSLKIDDTNEKPTEDNTTVGIDFINVFKPQENVKIIKDLDVEPCFSIGDIADCFIMQLDKIVESKSENIPMIGVFAPWGRGKSYFLNFVFQQLEKRNLKWPGRLKVWRESDTKRYKVIKFNAWKYQDTPAIWAYLYETIYQHTSWWQKGWLYITKYVISYKIFVLLLLISLSCGFGMIFNTKPQIIADMSNFVTIGGIGSIVSVIISFILTLRDNPISALKIIQKYTKRKSYNECLGIQNAIESDLEVLLRILKWRKDKVLLCVDDIDRSSTEKMVSIVDSLRTVLENEKIRERLIVICSIDIDKLMDGYKAVYRDNGTDLNTDNIREQIDKVFIFGMGLAKLGTSQLKEYLQKMISFNDSDKIEVISETLFNIDIQEGALYVAKSQESPITLSDVELYAIISKFIERNITHNITPRKLRIMYYQLLFANNLASKRGVVLTEKLINDLLLKSLTGNGDDKPNQALGDIIEMAVPY
ncbi:P-loop NTPase fold protein [Bacteroides sp. AN502(2024)]|uniref:P-loop NTPase fold protein n=1 Tax=Bacteroides sp. AN502(2024) TaxID=3160599 RepID=UPI00351155B9